MSFHSVESLHYVDPKIVSWCLVSYSASRRNYLHINEVRLSTCKDSVMWKSEIHSILSENEPFFGE